MKLYYFLLGMRQFRSAWTTSPPDDCRNAYEWGREIAHRLTMRRFEES